MKKILLLILAAFALVATPLARAWTYKSGDALLIFRESGFNDVEFDIGTVTNFLGKSNGYTTTVTGWDSSLVTSVFGSDLTGVSVSLLAVTSLTDASPTAWFSATTPQPYWFSGIEPVNGAYNVSPIVWQTYWSVLSGIGKRPVSDLVTASGTNSYSIDPAGSAGVASYDQIVGEYGYLKTASADWLAQAGGNAPFATEQVIPGSFGLVAVRPTTSVPKPLNSYIGTFTIGSDGTLTFVAGPVAPANVGITRSGNVSTVSFNTSVAGTYSLVNTNALGAPTANWPNLGASVIGDGNSGSITDTNSSATGFYQVQVN